MSEASGTVRLAIVGTPRSGNMWLRRLLVSTYGAAELSVDTPAQVPWGDLPASLVLQLHWPPDDQVCGLLREHGLASLAVARHPFDVLLSILQFAQHEARTARWLNGACGDERALVGADPASDAFRRYALGERAAALLGLTPAWQRSEHVVAGARYEELAADPVAALAGLASSLPFVPKLAPEEAVAANDLSSLRAETQNGHVWLGQPGLWRSLLPADLALDLASAHEDVLVALGYEAAIDEEAPSPEEARCRWQELSRRASRPPAREETAARIEAHLGIAAISADEFVERTYRAVLRRPVDEAARARAVTALEQGLLSRAGLLHEVTTSAEAKRVRILDDAVAFAAWARRAGERPRLLRGPAGTDEAVVAVPWVLARLRAHQRVLDVGSALAEPTYLAALVAAVPGSVVGVDLAELAAPQITAVQADVRRLPFERRSFDTIFCVSTLQHVGQDARPYGASEHDPDGPRDALRELRRVLATDGALFVTVPCGEPQDLGSFVQLDADGWTRLFGEAGFAAFELELYELRADGWQSTESLPAGLRYGERGPGASAVLCAELRPRTVRYTIRRRLSSLAAGRTSTKVPPAGFEPALPA